MGARKISESLTPRENLHRTLFVRGSHRLAPWLFAAITVYFLGMSLQTPWMYGLVFTFSSLLFALLGSLSYASRVPYRLVDVSNRALKLEGPNYKTEIPYASIQSAFVLKRPLNMSAFILVTADGKHHAFPHTLERSEYVMEAVSKARPDLKLDLKSFHTHAVVADHRLSRWNGKTQSFIFRSLFIAPVIVFAGYLYLFSKSEHFHHYILENGASAWFASEWLRILTTDLLIGFGLECFFTATELRQLKHGNKVRDRGFEQRVFRFSYLLYFASALGPLAYYFIV